MAGKDSERNGIGYDHGCKVKEGERPSGREEGKAMNIWQHPHRDGCSGRAGTTRDVQSQILLFEREPTCIFRHP